MAYGLPVRGVRDKCDGFEQSLGSAVQRANRQCVTGLLEPATPVT